MISFFSVKYYCLLRRYSFIFLLILAGFSLQAQSKDTLKASSLFPYGRYLLNKNGKLELISSGVHFGFRFTGSHCVLYASIPHPAEHNYLQYTLDGVYQKKIRVTGDGVQSYRITSPGNGIHIVWIYKTTEAQTGPIFIEQISGGNIAALKNPNLPLIEFIGNSITCGAAADPSEIPCGTGEYHDQHNAYYAYGPRIARVLNVNFMLSSVSGIGIYRNWNSLGPTMPQVYEKADFEISSSRIWNFKTYRPSIVSIALGTNDFSDGDHMHARLAFDSAAFVSNYIRFVKLVKSKYPGARIALLSSPMINGDRRILLQHCLSAVKRETDALYPGKKPVALFFFQPMQARGCGGHPNLDDHAILAQQLTPFFKKLLSL
jgi:Carbohydrate esterase 2 N-terminal/GDSL-like Lipase/Acylhydrolase family